MNYQVNSIIATLIRKDDAPKGSVGAIIGIKDSTPARREYLIELFTVKGHLHDQIYYDENEIYLIQQ